VISFHGDYPPEFGWISLLSHVCHVPHRSSLWYDWPNNIWWGYKLWGSSSYSFLSLLNVFCSILFLNIVCVYSSHNVTEKVTYHTKLQAKL
jgi:hypothetical protein